jgi:hypothetical protein
MPRSINLEDAGAFGFAIAMLGALCGAAIACGWFIYVWATSFAAPVVAAALSLCVGSVVFGVLLAACAVVLELLTKNEV